jgi:hypothetical protein
MTVTWPILRRASRPSGQSAESVAQLSYVQFRNGVRLLNPFAAYEHA